MVAMLMCTAAAAQARDKAASAAPADGASPAAAPSDTGNDIVVTARKARERLQDVPLAITALNGNRLRVMDHRRIEDLNQLAPSTNIVITNGRQSSYTIRGIGANPAGDGLESSTGVFLDGVYLGRPGMAAADFVDVDQIEVLRGPQGTLFGKNTTGGAINITTAAPSLTPGLLAQATIGNYGFQQYQASLTGPVTDTIAARLTGYSTTRDGTIDDVFTHKQTGTLDRSGLRGQLLFQPTADLSVRIIGEYTRERQSGGAVTLLPGPGANYAAIQKKLAATGATLSIDPNGLTTSIDGAATTGNDQYAASAQVDWRFGAGFKLTSISAYRSWHYSSLADSDLTSLDAVNSGMDVNQKQYSQELRIAIPHSRYFDAVAGVFYFGQRLTSETIAQYGSQAASFLTGLSDAQLPAVAASSAAVRALLNYNNSTWLTHADPRTDSYAGFAQGILHVTPRWNITGGIRLTYEKKTETVSRDNPFATATGQPIAALASSTVAPIAVQTSDTAPSFLASTDYHISSDVMVYALISRGEKASGFNTTVPSSALGAASLVVRPETAMNYEAGLKSSFFDRRLTVDVSVYRTDLHDYQSNYTKVIGGVAVSTITNVGSVRSQGGEAEITAHPFAGMSLHGFGGYTDAKYRSYPNAPCPVEATGQAVCDLTGRRVAGAPKWTAGADATYEHDIAENVTGYAGGEYSWRSKSYGTSDDSKYAIIGSYAIINLRLGLRAKDGPWDISVWGKNVANKHYATVYYNFTSLLPGAYASFFGDPATYGVTARVKF